MLSCGPRVRPRVVGEEEREGAAGPLLSLHGKALLGSAPMDRGCHPSLAASVAVALACHSVSARTNYVSANSLDSLLLCLSGWRQPGCLQWCKAAAMCRAGTISGNGCNMLRGGITPARVKPAEVRITS